MYRETTNNFRMDWRLLMVSWIIISTDTGSPTLLPSARPLSLFEVYRGVYHWRRLEVLHIGQQDKS